MGHGRPGSGLPIHKLWEATDKDALLARQADGIRAIATRGELGATRR